MEIKALISSGDFETIENLIKNGDKNEKEKIKMVLEEELISPSFGHKNEGIIPTIVADIYSTRREAKRKMLMYKALQAKLNQVA